MRTRTSFNAYRRETSAGLLRDFYRRMAVCIAEYVNPAERALFAYCVLTYSCALWLFHRNSLSIWQVTGARRFPQTSRKITWLPSRAASTSHVDGFINTRCLSSLDETAERPVMQPPSFNTLNGVSKGNEITALLRYLKP